MNKFLIKTKVPSNLINHIPTRKWLTNLQNGAKRFTKAKEEPTNLNNTNTNTNSSNSTPPTTVLYPPLNSLDQVNLTMPTIFRCLTMTLVGSLCKLFLNLLFQFQTQNLNCLLTCIQSSRQPKNQSLLTYMNHSSTLDDPLLWGCLPIHILSNRNKMRWSLAAKELLFKNWLYNQFFSAGQIVPTIRGDGIHQPAMQAAIQLLDKHRWVHIYPEGKVNQKETLLQFKWGIAHLILKTKTNPLILPIYQIGMVNILPEGRIKIPRLFQPLLMLVGTPIDIKKVLNQDPTYLNLKTESEKRIFITTYLQSQLELLKQNGLTWANQLQVDPGFIEQ